MRDGDILHILAPFCAELYLQVQCASDEFNDYTPIVLAIPEAEVGNQRRVQLEHLGLLIGALAIRDVRLEIAAHDEGTLRALGLPSTVAVSLWGKPGYRADVAHLADRRREHKDQAAQAATEVARLEAQYERLAVIKQLFSLVRGFLRVPDELSQNHLAASDREAQHQQSVTDLDRKLWQFEKMERKALIQVIEQQDWVNPKQRQGRVAILALSRHFADGKVAGALGKTSTPFVLIAPIPDRSDIIDTHE